MLAQGVSETPMPKIDLRIFWINVRYKLVIPVLCGILIALITHYFVKSAIPNKWEASTYVIRHGKNMARQANIPYLYLQTDLSTVIETILLRENLEHVIATLGLDMKPEDLRKAIQVNKGNKSNVIRITATAGTQEMSVKIADLVSDTFLANYTLVQNAAASKIHSYYESKLASSKQQLYSEQYLAKEFKDKYGILDFVAQKANLYKAISELELRHMDEQIRVTDLTSRLNEIDKKLNATGNTTLISEIVRTNENTLTQKLKSELEVLRKRYTDQNPKIQHLLHKISVLEKETAEKAARQPGGTVDERKFGYNPVYGELQLLKIQLESEIKAAQGNLSAYQNNIQLKRDALSELSKLEQKHFQIEQNIVSTQDLIKNLNNRVMEASIALESNISDFDILEYAQTPEHPKRSFRKVITIGVAFMAMLGLAFLILVREYLNNTVKTAFDLNDISNAKFTSVLPNKDQVSKATFYSQFHLFFSALKGVTEIDSSKLITISSVSHSEGKSFTCNEIIEQLNNQGKKVLYIETLNEESNAPNESTINHALKDSSKAKDLIFNEIGASFYKGYYKTNDQMYLDIITEENLGNFLQALDSGYDVIIWELFEPNIHYQFYKTILRGASFNLISSLSGVTPKSELARLTNLLQDWKITSFGVLLNALPNKYIRRVN